MGRGMPAKGLISTRVAGAGILFSQTALCRQQDAQRILELQHIAGNYGLNLRDIAVCGKLKLNFTKAAEIQFQFAVHIEYPWSLNGKGLDFAIGQGGEIFLLPGHSLQVHGDNALTCEDNFGYFSIDVVFDKAGMKTMSFFRTCFFYRGRYMSGETLDASYASAEQSNQTYRRVDEVLTA